MKHFDNNLFQYSCTVSYASPSDDASLLSAHFTTVYLNNIHKQTHNLLYNYIKIQPIFF